MLIPFLGAGAAGIALIKLGTMSVQVAAPAVILLTERLLQVRVATVFEFDLQCRWQIAGFQIGSLHSHKDRQSDAH